MKSKRILIVNGPNLGHLGERQPEIYGTQGMDAVPGLAARLLGERARDVSLEFFQANGEGELIDRLERARAEGVEGLVINAGAYTHTSLALADCLAWIGIPCMEVHLSNILGRKDEPMRNHSLLAKHCVGVIAGLGILGYALAVLALAERS